MIYIATYIRKLKDRNGNYITPATRSKGVYMEDNTTLSLLSSYPVGSIYQSVNTTSPASLFGGSWEKIEGRFLLGSSSEYDLGDTGGASEFKQTWSQLGQHNHAIYSKDSSPTAHSTNKTVFDTVKYPGLLSWTNVYTITGSAITLSPGVGEEETNVTKSMSIMPPYRVVNTWYRVS